LKISNKKGKNIMKKVYGLLALMGVFFFAAGAWAPPSPPNANICRPLKGKLQTAKPEEKESLEEDWNKFCKPHGWLR
jgi:hypothetical protein